MKHLESINDAPWKDPIFENEHLCVFLDAVPVNPGHRLYVPKTNNAESVERCFRYAFAYGKELIRQGKCDGYNVGMNNGESAGQTISWPHIHLIPRMNGDMENPQGGVRHVIPDRGNYKTSAYYDKPEYDYVTGRTR